ncbi:hypothetical protein Pla123a_27080 [Posidoniimonas polymericola]|uniref:Vitamin K-dependent gamma-carboxylase n=1 Tax=Posidoniimonas polymericola TaxID=2528002 RepID=A0A5C5YLT6_9BACT|nr:hypothetical protein [Posidoniimonas polymericola]TWT75923.1 hypothetical protein Pla123a_27080 [Posidoniimonas polymericola]
MSDLPPVTDEHSTGRAAWLARLWAVATPLLVGVTWPLWSGAARLPAVPAADWLRTPPFVGPLLLAGAAWGALCVLRGKCQTGLAYGVVCLGGLMLLDQLRWQPWAYHLLIMAVVLLTAGPTLAVRLLRALAVSVYFYSAVAKLDYAFASTLGRQMLEAATGWVGLSPREWPVWLVFGLALAMPVAEGLIAPLLCFRKTRRVGLLLATAMHAGAVLVLGPLGLGHRPGVLLWNLVFPTHLWLLFGPPIRSAGMQAVRARPSWAPAVAVGIVVLAIVGPLTRPLGWWDRWPSWGLYAPGGERTEVLVHRSVVDRLPDSLPLDSPDEATGRAPTPDADEQSDWRRLRLDEWSLGNSWAPLYPQRRTTIALARSIQSSARLGDFLRVDLYTAANRFSGERQVETLLGAKAIDAYAERYWLNAKSGPLP